ncbi:MAG: polysaccharide deacetylase family protein, partial [Clostridia bacterium]|nr:polysaccharide deacetylase family protein [Clostridia bacterium]
PLNLDLETKSLLTADQLFSQHSRLLFFCESHLAGLLNTPSDGYSVEPDAAFLQKILLGYEGLEVFLTAGHGLPTLYGDLSFTIPYSQAASLMQVDSPLIKSKVRKIDPSKPMIALTFDDGPSEHTLRILRVLAQYDGRATFCVQGYNVETYPEIVKLAVAQGNEIASHTWSHPNLTEISSSRVRSQLERTNAVVAQVADGYQIKVLRPPYGATNRTVRNICADLDMIIAHWQIDTLDWEHRNANKTYKNVISKAKPGAIVLCHDIYENTAIAMEKAIPELVAQGYQLVTVSELFSFHQDGAKPGTVYSHLKPENTKVD